MPPIEPNDAAPVTPTPTPPAQVAPVAIVTPTPPIEQTDWKSEARKWEDRAKENKDAADRLATLEAASKVEAETYNESLKQATKDAESARTDALRLRIALTHGVSTEDAELFLTASDEETLTKQAQRLAARAATPPAPPTPGVHIPSEGSGQVAPPSLAAQIADAEKAGDVAVTMRLKAQQLADLRSKQ